METYQYILLTIYLCINFFFAGAEWADNRYTKYTLLGVLGLAIPTIMILFLYQFFKLVIKYRFK